MSELEISILLKTSEYRGDHSADITEAFIADPDETVAELITRLGLQEPVNDKRRHVDHIEIRVAQRKY